MTPEEARARACAVIHGEEACVDFRAKAGSEVCDSVAALLVEVTTDLERRVFEADDAKRNVRHELAEANKAIRGLGAELILSRDTPDGSYIRDLKALLAHHATAVAEADALLREVIASDGPEDSIAVNQKIRARFAGQEAKL